MRRQAGLLASPPIQRFANTTKRANTTQKTMRANMLQTSSRGTHAYDNNGSGSESGNGNGMVAARDTWKAANSPWLPWKKDLFMPTMPERLKASLLLTSTVHILVIYIVLSNC